MQALEIETTQEKIKVTFDRKALAPEQLIKLLDVLRMEFLANQINFDASIEELGNEIKHNWWQNNKHRYIK